MPLTIQVVRDGRTTCLTVVGRVDESNRERLGEALRTADLTAATRVELDLARLDSCDVDTAFELAAFAGKVRGRGGDVGLTGANRWVLTMLTLADVAGAVTVPPLDSGASPWLRPDASPDQAVALRWLLDVLDHGADGVDGVHGVAQGRPGHEDGRGVASGR